jgi:uncharacterized membrane protein
LSSVFVPTTPNPTTGFLQVLPEKDVVRTGLTVEEGVKMIMSLGALIPQHVSGMREPAELKTVPRV